MRPYAFRGLVLAGLLTVLCAEPASAAAGQMPSGLFDVTFDFELEAIPSADAAVGAAGDPGVLLDDAFRGADPSPAAAADQIIEPSDIAPAGATWRGAVADSLRLLMIEHTWRVALQDKTRRELGGPFWGDYVRSVKLPRTWNDGDGWVVNYVGHPIHGAASGFIWLDHEDGAHDPDLGFSREYWGSRGRAFAWSAAYSLQFEFGLLSEASIGNVGLRENTTGWVDHVVTPVGALAFMVAEDALDRYLVRRIENWTDNRFLRAAARMALNPSRTLSNAAQGRFPWFRVGRPIVGSGY